MSSSIRMVIRVLPDGARRTAPRRPYLKSYCFFISYPRSDGARVASPFSRRSVVDDPRATCRQPPERVHSQRDEPVLRVRALIGDGDRLLVVKHRSRVGEVDAMLAQIGDGLARIPFQFHSLVYAQTYIPSRVFVGAIRSGGAEGAPPRKCAQSLF